jgi:3-methyladenine DNA glycosylase AlkD
VLRADRTRAAGAAEAHRTGAGRHAACAAATRDLPLRRARPRVDEIASHLVGQVLLDHRTHDAWAVDADSLWIRRTAMLAQLRHREETDTDLLARVLVANLDDTAYGKDFFIRKALGWSLREHAKTDAVWVEGFVSTHTDRLSGLSRREALKHLQVSTRSSQTGTSSTAPTA